MLLVPRGTPEPIRARLAGAMREALANPEVVRRLRDEGAERSTMDGPGFAQLIRAERERWAQVVRQADITVDWPRASPPAWPAPVPVRRPAKQGGAGDATRRRP